MPEQAAAGLPARIEADDGWLSTKELAVLAGIIPRNARSALACCIEGGTWRGHRLQVRQVNGTSYQVLASSLPMDLQVARQASQPQAPAPVPEAATLPAASSAKLPPSKDIEAAKWMEEVIGPALEHRKGSRARGGAIKQIAGQKHIGPDGQPIKINERTLRDWIEKYEQGGTLALVRKVRVELDSRVIINRRWDKACPLPDATKKTIAEALETYTKSLWAQSNPGWNKAEQLASSRLMELSIEGGWPEASYENCRVGRHFVERYKGFKIVHIKNRDDRTYRDLYRPRIIRDHSLCEPMDSVVGDVHPMDMQVAREDGSIATPRMIAWLDPATHDIFYGLVLLEKGQGITQADVWASFAAMVECWGLPKTLYLDNGSEYFGNARKGSAALPEILEGFNRLTGLAAAQQQFMAYLVNRTRSDQANVGTGKGTAASEYQDRTIIRALPYNAPAKPIEGAFGILEKFFALLDGHIGGDRMKKKTPKLGKTGYVWPNLSALERAIEEAVAFYRNSPQQGNLKGKSPNQAKRDYIDQGWKATGVSREALVLAMSESRSGKVTNQGIQIDKVFYDGAALIPYRNQKATVRYAPWAPERIILEVSEKEIAWVERAPIFHPADAEGAKRASRMNGILARHVKDLKAETTPLNMVEEIARHNATQEPAPETPFGPVVGVDGRVRQLIEQTYQLPPPKPMEIVKPVENDSRSYLRKIRSAGRP